MAQVLFPALAAAAAAKGASLGTVLLFGAAKVGVGLVSSFALSALAPKPDFSGLSGGFLVNEVDPVAAREYVYGEVRKGGTIVFEESTNGNDVLHRVIVLAAHECESVGQIYLNDEPVTISDDSYSETIRGKTYEGAGWVISDAWRGDNGGPRIRLYIHDGTQTSTTDAFANTPGPNFPQRLSTSLLLETESGLDSTFVGRGLTYIYMRAAIDSEAYAGGIPRITAVVKGRKVFDPRTSQTAYSANWALCLADYLQASWGLGDVGKVDTTQLIAEADVCDEDVALDAGGTQKRYEMNGVIRADQTPGEILSQMMPSGVGSVYWGQAQWNLRSGHYTAPVKTLGLTDIRSSITLETKTPRAQNFNQVQGAFNDKSQRWIPGEYPQITSATFLSEDNGFENVLNFDLPYETDPIRAQRLAKLALFRQREQIRMTADFSLAAIDLRPGETVGLTIDRYGWANKPFEVEGWSLRIDGEQGDLRVAMTLKETSSAAFDWNAEETVFASNNTNLTNYKDAATVSLNTPTVQQIRNPGGGDMPLLLANWTVTDAHLSAEYIFQWRENTIDYDAEGGFVELSSPTAREQDVYDAYLAGLIRVADQNGFNFYVSGGGSGLTKNQIIADLANSAEGIAQADFNSIVVGTTSAELRVLEIQKRYDLRVVSRNHLGYLSNRSSTTFLVVPDTTAPPVPTHTGKTNNVLGSQATIRWNNPPLDGFSNPVYDLDSTEVWRSSAASLSLDGNGDPTNADRLGISKTEEFIDTSGVALATYYYFERAIDFAGNKSAFSAGREVVLQSPGTGQSGVSPALSPESLSIPADSDGSNPVLTNAITTMSIFLGAADDSANWTYAITGTSNATASIAGPAVTITGFTDDTGYIDITASKSGFTDITKRFTLAKARAGVAGDPGLDGQDGTPGADGQDGAQGPPGDDGSDGQDGAPGSDGSDGAPGADGTDGKDTIEIVIETPAAVLTATASGVVSDYSNSGTRVYAYAGTTQLTYDTGSPGNGEYRVSVTSITPSSSISVGSRSKSGIICIVADHSAMSPGVDQVEIRYTVDGYTPTGDYFTRAVTQIITKAKAGSDGADGVDGQDGADGANGADGATGATGDTIATGTVYFQTLQANAPSKPSATSFNTTTGAFSGLTSNWDRGQPPVEVTDTSLQEWRSDYTVQIAGVGGAQTINFTTPSGAIQIDSDLESDNFAAGSAGWRIERDTGNAEFGAASIRGQLEVNQLKVDNVIFDTDGSGNLIIANGGISTDQVQEGALSEHQFGSTDTDTDLYTLNSWTQIHIDTFSNDAEGDLVIDWSSIVKAIATTTPTDTDFVNVELRSRSTVPGAGTLTRTWPDFLLYPNQTLQWQHKVPNSDLGSRSAGTVTFRIEMRIVSRSNSYMGVKATWSDAEAKEFKR